VLISTLPSSARPTDPPFAPASRANPI